MKATVSFEIDCTDFPAYNAPDKGEIRRSIQEISCLFSELHTHQLEKIMKAHARGTDLEPEAQKSYLEYLEAKAKLSNQLFNNFRVQGVTDDGHSFEFTHKEPGYEEKLTIDGQDADKPADRVAIEKS